MPADQLDILYEDNHCLAVVKPARMLIAGDETGDVSLLDLARDYIRVKYHKPGDVYLGLVHRLDRPVSGVVLFARTSKAAARLSDQFRTGTIRKVYHAVVAGIPSPATGRVTDWLLKDSATNLVRRVAPHTAGAKESTLEYRLIRPLNNGLSLLEVTPLTGRSHQIRVQLAGLGTPIYGDTKYGSRHVFDGMIALHAARLTFEHPTRRESITLSAPEPAAWKPLLGSGR